LEQIWLSYVEILKKASGGGMAGKTIAMSIATCKNDKENKREGGTKNSSTPGKV